MFLYAHAQIHKSYMFRRDFLWGGCDLDKKPHLGNWLTVCTDKKVGGLGVKSLSILSRALLCKWIWCFAHERDALWRDVNSWKFGFGGGGGGVLVFLCFLGCLWLWGLEVVRKEWETATSHAIFSLGNGRRLCF